MKWIVTNVPVWAVALVLVVALPGLAIGAKALIGKRVAVLGSDSHNDVAGFLVAVVAVIYAVVIGFTIVSLYEESVTASTDLSTEASDLLQLHEGTSLLGSSTAAQLDTYIVGYAQGVVQDWPTIAQGETSSTVQHNLDNLYATLNAYRPRTAAERDELNQAIIGVNNLSQARVTRQLEASEAGTLPLALWIGILVTSAVTMGFTLLFSLDKVSITYMMVGGVAAVLAVNLFMLIELSYPFLGAVGVGPGKFQYVVNVVSAAH